MYKNTDLAAAEAMLAERALAARERSYSPYSGYAVGAALLAADGTVYEGANIENAAYTPTVCAERTAFFRAILDGKREFVAIAVAGGKAGEEPADFFPPCGVCRQVMAEFCTPDFRIILTAKGRTQTLTLSELLPHGFSGRYL